MDIQFTSAKGTDYIEFSDEKDCASFVNNLIIFGGYTDLNGNFTPVKELKINFKSANLELDTPNF
jgi:hypothetical protein